MASINSLMNSSSSSVSSIYGNRNIISGLASGMDTEAMIENSIAGYKTKIQNLMNQQTRLTWKQDAYRGITDKLIALSEKYTSYRSKTNLSSSSFFNKAVKSESNGTYASKIAATGKSSSDVQINGVKQLATAATYRVGVDALTNLQNVGSLTSGAIDWNAPEVNVSDITGSLTINVDKTSVSLSFTNDETKNIKTADELAGLINKKLQEAEVGGDKKGSDYVKTEVKDGKIIFSQGSEAPDGAGVYFSSASGSIVKTLGIKTTSNFDSGYNTLDVSEPSKLSHKVSMAESLSGKTISVTLDGTTKKIALGQYAKDLTGDDLMNAVMKDLKDGLQDSFGDKVEVRIGQVDGTDRYQLKFSPKFENSTLKISSDAGSYLGMGGDLTNYLNTGSTLGQLLGSKLDNSMALEAVGTNIKNIETKDGKTTGTDEAGNMVVQDKDNKWYRVNADGEKLYRMTVNGKTVGDFTAKTAMDTVMNAINNSEAGVKASYSQMTNQFTFTATETGSEGKIEFGDGLGTALFGKVDTNDTTKYTAGQDAVLNVTVNGQNLDLTRSSNVVNIDGLSVTLKGTFNEGMTKEEYEKVSGEDAVTFTTSADADNIVDAVKSFVEQVNDILSSVHEAYSTKPNGTYNPLSDEDKADMSESEIKTYEEKAKSGLLFGDRDLSRLYNDLRKAVIGNGMDVAALRDIGITNSYSNGVTSLELDEDKLREALAADPDKVRSIFTKSKENGASSDGLMANVSKVLDRYASTRYGDYGLLVKQAGTKTKSLSLMDNTIQKQIDSYENQIDSWKLKMSDKIDYYTRQFTALEQLINTMNSQSSALSGLMGG